MTPADPTPTQEPVYTIDAVTERNFGDHGAMMAASVETVEGETVRDMILRALPELSLRYGRASEHDHIVIRVTAESVARMREATKEADSAPQF